MWGKCGGGGLRGFPGKKQTLLLDHGYNALRHGHPMMERPVTLAGRGPRWKVPEAQLLDQQQNFRLCTNPECMMACDPKLTVCPQCGAKLKIGKPPKERRHVELVKFKELPAAERDKFKVAERRTAFFQMQMMAVTKAGQSQRDLMWQVSYKYAARFGIMPHEDRIFFTKGERESYWDKRKK